MSVRNLSVLACVLVALSLAVSRTPPRMPPAGLDNMRKQVRNELTMLPLLSVFDNLGYRMNGSQVTLVGQVTRLALKSDAELAVKKIQGVEHISNLIEILPVSPVDNTLRLRLFRAIYGYMPMEKYALGVNKPIRIIVQDRHVTLEGVVDCQADKDMVGIRANSVPGVLSVVNNLQISN